MIRIERKVCPEDSFSAALTVSSGGERGSVTLTTDNPCSADYFGQIGLTLNYKLMRELAKAILEACYEAEDEMQTKI